MSQKSKKPKNMEVESLLEGFWVAVTPDEITLSIEQLITYLKPLPEAEQTALIWRFQNVVLSTTYPYMQKSTS